MVRIERKTMNQTVQATVGKGAERRKEKRYEVQLDGQLGVDGKVVPVRIGDISASGALLIMAGSPPEGTIGDLWITGFGDLEIEVAYSGDGMCGVMFTHPALCRDKLLKWLTEDVASKTGPGQ
jgi:PilZ domain